MRFVCESCRAQYMISDDKVGPKGVKVRCKKCGHTITVRPAGAPAAKESAPEAAPASSAADSSAASMPASLGTPPEGGLFTDVEEDEIGAVFDQVLSSGTHKVPAGEAAEAAAREASAENVRKLAEAEAEPAKEDAKSNAAAHEWYVAIDEKQVGPFTVEKVKDLWDRGEVGPDSLCWRSGFSDWIPLSETAELASVLAPRPSKPVIVAPEPVSTSTPTVQAGPVQSAFSAGKGARGDSAPASSSEEPMGWKPSAASVLASLVKEENDALSKPPPTPAPALGREPVSQSRLLDVPMPPPEPVSSPSLPGAGPMMGAPMAPAAQMPYGAQPGAPYPTPPVQQAPYVAPPQQYAQPMAAPYPQPGYPPAYPPPGGAQGGGKSKTGMLVGAAAAFLFVAGGAVVFFVSGNNNRSDTPAVTPPAAAQPAATNMPPMPPPPSGVAQNTQPAAPAAAPGTPATAPAAAPGTAPGAAVAAAPGTTPAAAPGTAPAAPATPPAAVAAAPTTPPATAPAKPAEPPAVAKVDRSGTTRRPASGSSRREEPEERPQVARAERPSSSDGDDFDELFGTKKPKQETKQPEARPTAYVPPEPGGATPERLQQSDIMAVVLANKPAIVKCVNEQKKKDPALSGKLVMRWTIQTSGKTTAVSCRTDEFRTTYMATCISGLIKSWSFPKHKKQGEPIDFPFTF
ncbi:adventurous gliding motility protein GltJ [Pyxidicoccus fallax]|uniref:Adventurous gliding motility protein GltJ n=1 Tax=Pyxidicoccus fallax TaxID=394095 RepID=A0A848LB54_9BACT|nr:adventurous gliding motility protein GltJ [Pyxidicoccus fallax]NMO15734.1 adventurous gliding motility protein GltJ [Pyxidicoccus fallax]NPC79726.1 adventurous gliding motility protein GltJ [Pyxidicoccus fallax]